MRQSRPLSKRERLQIAINIFDGSLTRFGPDWWSVPPGAFERLSATYKSVTGLKLIPPLSLFDGAVCDFDLSEYYVKILSASGFGTYYPRDMYPKLRLVKSSKEWPIC